MHVPAVMGALAIVGQETCIVSYCDMQLTMIIACGNETVITWYSCNIMNYIDGNSQILADALSLVKGPQNDLS